MWNGYLRLGGNEIVNTPRVAALASSLGLPLGIECDECPGLADMAGAVYGDAEEFGDVTTAPWYDANDPASEDFIGFVGLGIRYALDSTREAPVFQRLGDGGVLGRERHRTREVRVSGLLIGRDRLSLDYGMNWLSSALARNSCGQHGMTCGLADLEWLADCPTAQGAETDPDYAATVAPLRRFVHDVGTTSGPLLLEERETDCFQLYEIEFTITAQEPHVFGAPKAFELTPAMITGKSDVVRNLIKAPSGEILDYDFSSHYYATNFVTNPSFEKSLNRWSSRVEVLQGTAPTEPPLLVREVTAIRPWGIGNWRASVIMSSYEAAGSEILVGAYHRMSHIYIREGAALKAGALLRPLGGGYPTTWGIRLSCLDSQGDVLDQVEFITSDLSLSGEMVMTRESLVIPPGGTEVEVYVFQRSITGSGGVVSRVSLDIDAVWVKGG